MLVSLALVVALWVATDFSLETRYGRTWTTTHP